MIDFSSERVMRLGEAAALLGVRYGTVHRWAKYGTKSGRKLESAFLGGTAYTSREAIQRFSGQHAPPLAECQPGLPRGHEEAMRRLAQRANGVKEHGKAKAPGRQKGEALPALQEQG